MKKKLLPVGAFLGLVLIGVLLLGCQTAGGELNSNQQQGISVSGEGKVSVVPDVASLQLGIQAQAKTVAEAQNQASDAMNQVMTALTSNGVASKDIQTSYFSIQKITRYDQNTQQEVTTGYSVTNLVNAKIRILAQESYTLDYKVGRIIDAVAQAGGDFTQVNSINFTVDNPQSYYDQARQKAMTDATHKASSLADLAGVKLGKPISIVESGTAVPPPSPFYAKAAADSTATTPISPGELEITLDVQVIYSIR